MRHSAELNNTAFDSFRAVPHILVRLPFTTKRLFYQLCELCANKLLITVKQKNNLKKNYVD